MGRAPCCEKNGMKKGPWTPEEDKKLMDYIHNHGYGNWRTLPKNAGLERCGKSCRLRWTNYLRPDIKRGRFSNQEEDTIIQLHSILGNKWSAIAARLPGRTDNEIKNYWNTHIRKKLLRMGIDPVTHTPRLDLLDLSSILTSIHLNHLNLAAHSHNYNYYNSNYNYNYDPSLKIIPQQQNLTFFNQMIPSQQIITPNYDVVMDIIPNHSDFTHQYYDLPSSSSSYAYDPNNNNLVMFETTTSSLFQCSSTDHGDADLSTPSNHSTCTDLDDRDINNNFNNMLNMRFQIPDVLDVNDYVQVIN